MIRHPGKSRGWLRSGYKGPTILKKEPVVRERKRRLNRDSKDMRNPPRKSNTQADPANEMVVKTVDLRDQICFGGPRPGTGNLPC